MDIVIFPKFYIGLLKKVSESLFSKVLILLEDQKLKS